LSEWHATVVHMVEYAKLHLSLDGEPFPLEWTQMQGNFGDALEEWGARQGRTARLSQLPPRRITRQGVRPPLPLNGTLE
jgi:hypothetical protein